MSRPRRKHAQGRNYLLRLYGFIGASALPLYLRQSVNWKLKFGRFGTIVVTARFRRGANANAHLQSTRRRGRSERSVDWF